VFVEERLYPVCFVLLNANLVIVPKRHELIPKALTRLLCGRAGVPASSWAPQTALLLDGVKVPVVMQELSTVNHGDRCNHAIKGLSDGDALPSEGPIHICGFHEGALVHWQVNEILEIGSCLSVSMVVPYALQNFRKNDAAGTDIISF